MSEARAARRPRLGLHGSIQRHVRSGTRDLRPLGVALGGQIVVGAVGGDGQRDDVEASRRAAAAGRALIEEFDFMLLKGLFAADVGLAATAFATLTHRPVAPLD